MTQEMHLDFGLRWAWPPHQSVAINNNYILFAHQQSLHFFASDTSTSDSSPPEQLISVKRKILSLNQHSEGQKIDRIHSDIIHF